MKRTLVIAAIVLGLIILYALTGGNQSTCCGSGPVPPGLAPRQISKACKIGECVPK